MTSLRSWFVSAAALAGSMALASQAHAQAPEGKLTVSVNFGAQSGSHTLTQTLTPTIYDEAATINIEQKYDTGAMEDFGANYLVFGKIGFGVAYSHASGSGDAVVAAQIPDPLITDSPRSATSGASGLGHTEDALHLSATYRFAASPKFDVTVGIGPTIFWVNQELVSTVNVTETTDKPPFGTPVLAPVVVKGKDTAVGVNVSADATYMVTKTFGAGVLLRYAASTAKIPVANGSPTDIDAGGFQFAVGLRVRF